MEMVNETQKEFRFKTYGPKYIFQGPRLEWGIIVLRLNDELGLHYHNEVEETFYFLSGKGEIVINGKKFFIKSGDAFRIEPKEKHNIICNGEEIRAIFIKYPYLPQDKVSV